MFPILTFKLPRMCVDQARRRPTYYGTIHRQTGSFRSEGDRVMCLAEFPKDNYSLCACSEWCSERSSTLQ